MRVPQRHIATYLGITNVSLSRIKARKISPLMKSSTNDLCLG